MTKREAEMVRKLVQCYREHRDDRLLDVLEMLTEGVTPQLQLPPRHTMSLAYGLEDRTNAENSTEYRSPCGTGSTIDSSGVTPYCDDVEDGQKTDENDTSVEDDNR
jgi:hypothetical protein